MNLSFVFGGIGRALANPQYRLFWSGNAISTIGRWIYRTAVGWLVWDLTKDPKWLGIVAFASVFPMVLLSIVSGAISDRVGSLKLIKLNQLGMCVMGGTFAASVYAGFLSIELIVAISVVQGVIDAMSTPPRMAIVHSLVTRDELSAAIAMNSAMFNAARVLGPAIGGSLLLWADVGAVLILATLAFVQFYFVLQFIRVSAEGRGESRITWALFADVKDGIVYVWRHEGIRFLMLLLSAGGLLIRPVMELAPGFAAKVFERGPEGYAMLLSSIGGGALVASLWLARRGRTEGLTPLVVVSLVVQGVAVIAFAFSGHIYAGAACMAAMGFFMLVGGVGSQTLIQNAVDPAMRGRAVSLYILFSWGLPAIGALVAGWIASAAGLQPTIATGAALTVLVWLWARPAGRRLAKDLEGAGPEARGGSG